MTQLHYTAWPEHGHPVSYCSYHRDDGTIDQSTDEEWKQTYHCDMQVSQMGDSDSSEGDSSEGDSSEGDSSEGDSSEGEVMVIVVVIVVMVIVVMMIVVTEGGGLSGNSFFS